MGCFFKRKKGVSIVDAFQKMLDNSTVKRNEKIKQNMGT